MPRFPGRSRITIRDNHVSAAEHIDFMERAELLFGLAPFIRAISISVVFLTRTRVSGTR
jgi:hypothetical protein